jgi:hypothetical protein
MNKIIYKQIQTLAESLMEAVDQEDQASFDKDYAQLQQICEEHEGTDEDHPVQWEILAEFTGELDLAITIFDKALIKAEAIDSIDFCSSIGFSIATLKLELDDKKGAIESLEKANIACEDIEDTELKAEIHELLTELTSAS